MFTSGTGSPAEKTIGDLVLDLVTSSSDAVFIDSIVSAVIARRPDVKEASVRSEVAAMAARERPPIQRVRRGWYVASRHDGVGDTERLTDRLRALLDDATEQDLIEPARYASSALALVDAVFSQRSRSSSVQRVVQHVIDATGLEDVQDASVSALLYKIDGAPGATMDERLFATFGSLQRSAGRLKSSIVADLATRLRLLVDHERRLEIPLDSRRDFNALALLPEKTQPPERSRAEIICDIEASLTDPRVGVRGVGTATVRYLLVLMGIDVVKPDQRLIRWTQGALGGNVAPPTPALTSELIERAVRSLQREGYQISIRAVDHLIWRVQGGLLPHLAEHQLGPSVGSRAATRRSSAALGVASLTVGDAVDWNPRRARTTHLEKWHGTIKSILGHGRAVVEWTESNSTSEFRPRTNIPLRNRTRSSTAIIPYRESTSIEDLVPCDESESCEHHPGPPPPPQFEIGDEVLRRSGRATGAKWKGTVVGIDSARRDRFVVHWTEIILDESAHELDRDDPVFESRHCVEPESSLVLYNPYNAIDFS